MKNNMLTTKGYIRRTVYNHKTKKELGFTEFICSIETKPSLVKNAEYMLELSRNQTIEFLAGKLGMSVDDIWAPGLYQPLTPNDYEVLESHIKTHHIKVERGVVISDKGQVVGRLAFIRAMSLSTGDRLSEDLTLFSIKDDNTTGKLKNLFVPYKANN